jgi:GTPase SAR1 family protein
MGCIASYLAYLEEKRQEGMNLRIEKEQLVNKKRGEEVIKLLLLGAGESGKSTIFRQMKLLYGRSYDEENLRVLAHVVYANIISNLLVVLSNASLMGVQVRASDLAEEFLRTVNDEMVIDKALAEKVKQLWADPGVQQVWAQRSTFQVLDSLEYYMEDDNFARIGSDHYLPTFLDILHSRIRTSGIVEERYVIDGVQFTVFDVGGQRNERKKWIHSFSDVHAVIFVTAINEWVFEAICTNASGMTRFCMKTAGHRESANPSNFLTRF